MAELCNDGGKRVVIAKYLVVSGFDLGRRDGVIFIDNGNDSHLQQGFKGTGQMLRALGIVHIVAGEEDLCHGTVVLGKQFIINMHQLTLTHGGCSLLHAKLFWACRQGQFGSAYGDRAGGY